MKILQVTPAYPPTLGGVEQHVHDISRALRRLGHEVTVVSADGDRLPAEEQREGMAIYRLATVGHGVYRAPLGLRAFLRRNAGGFDIIHAHNIHALPLLVVAQVCGARAVVSPYYHGRGHSQVATFLHRFYTPVARAALQRVGGVICISASERRLVAERLAVPESHITVIPSIVEPASSSAPPAAERLPGRLLLAVGRLESYKRVDRAVAALAYLPADVRLAVVGTGPAQAELERQAAALGLSERVMFFGRVSDAELAQWYRRARVVVSFSEAESFGRTVAEALAHGCRVVGNALPTYREFAASYPQAVSLVPSWAGARADAAALLATLARPGPLDVDLERFSSAAVAHQLVKIYSQVGDRYQWVLSA